LGIQIPINFTNDRFKSALFRQNVSITTSARMSLEKGPFAIPAI
jgi:hypothetical protein